MDDNHPQEIYHGHSELAKKLTNPAKPHVGSDRGGQSVIHKPGKGLHETEHLHDPEYEKHHGYYDFDLSTPKDDRDVDSLSDEEILGLLSFRDRIKVNDLKSEDGRLLSDLEDHEKVKDKRVKEMIDKKRSAMKKSQDENTPGYNALKEQVSRDVMSNWLKLTSMGVLDKSLTKDKKTVKDPLTGKETNLYWIPHEKTQEFLGTKSNLVAGFNERIKSTTDPLTGKKVGRDVEPADPSKVQNLDIPVILRKITYEILDINGDPIPSKDPETKKETTRHTHDIFVPYLPDMKVLPRLTDKVALTPDQKALIVHRNGARFDQKDPNSLIMPETDAEARRKKYEEIMTSGDKTKIEALKKNSNIQDVSNLLRNWDILTPEQQQYIKDNSEDLLNVSKAINIKDKDLRDKFLAQHPHASPESFMNPGWQTNNNKAQQSSLGVENFDKLYAIIDKYYKPMVLDARAGVYGWVKSKRGGASVATEEDKESFSRLASEEKQWYSQNYDLPEKLTEKLDNKSSSLFPVSYDPNVNMEVVKILQEQAETLTTIFAYLLVTYLNDPRMGVNDDALGLNEHKTDEAKEGSKDFGGFGAARNRVYRIMKEMQLLSQLAVNSNVGSRRKRAVHGVVTTQNVEDKEGEEGGTTNGMANVTKDATQKRLNQQGAYEDEDTTSRSGPLDVWAPNRHNLKTDVNKKAADLRVAMQQHEIPPFLADVATRIHIQLRGLADKVVTDDRESLSFAIVQHQLMYDEKKKGYDWDNMTPEQQQKAQKEIDGQIEKELPARLAMYGIKKKNINVESVLKSAREARDEKDKEQQHSAAGLEDLGKVNNYDKDDPEFTKKLQEASDHFFERLIKVNETPLPIYNPTNHSFETNEYDPENNIALDEFFGEGGINKPSLENILKKMKGLFIRITGNTLENNQIKEVINSALETYGPSVIKKAYSAGGHTDRLMTPSASKELYQKVREIVPKLEDIQVRPQAEPTATQAQHYQPVAMAAAPTADLLRNYEQELGKWHNVPTVSMVNTLVQNYEQVRQEIEKFAKTNSSVEDRNNIADNLLAIIDSDEQKFDELTQKGVFGKMINFGPVSTAINQLKMSLNRL